MKVQPRSQGTTEGDKDHDSRRLSIPRIRLGIAEATQLSWASCASSIPTQLLQRGTSCCPVSKHVFTNTLSMECGYSMQDICTMVSYCHKGHSNTNVAGLKISPWATLPLQQQAPRPPPSHQPECTPAVPPKGT
eukprot:1161489-Pelagomonas_calceolata.AAC.3